MPSKTYHVLPAPKGWVLRQAGAADAKPFPTQREAIGGARKLLAADPGQIVIHNADGKIRGTLFYKVPKIQPPVMPGGVKARKIEKAVNSIVFNPPLSLAH